MTDRTTAGIQDIIESAWKLENKAMMEQEHVDAIALCLKALSEGQLRVAEKIDGAWKVNEWLKKAILLHFQHTHMRPMKSGIFEYFDKIRLRGHWESSGARIVPPAVVRDGAYIAPRVILMPSYVNIGAYVDEGTMIDTWATVGSCAQIGKNCHISGGVGIGGVLEPLQANPVIIEDNVFIGARCEVAEGIIVEQGAVLAMGCYVGGSTKLYNAIEGKLMPPGRIPANAVIVPGSLPSADGSHQTYALILKKFRDSGTDAKTALNELLR